MHLLISHCNTEDCIKFGLTYFDTEAECLYLVDLSKANLDPTNDVGLTGITCNSDFIYIGVQSVKGGKILVFDHQLNHQNTINLKLAEDIHALDFHAGKLYCTSTRNSRLVEIDPKTLEENIFWQHDKYIHFNDVKFFQGECYILSQDSLGENNAGGTVTRISDNKTIASGLNQPHSLFFHQDQLYTLSSRNGEVCRIDYHSPETKVISSLPGYTRGILCLEDSLIIGTSADRLHSRKQGPEKVFTGENNAFLADQKYCSAIYTLDYSGNVLKQTDITAVNFEIYEIFPLNLKPATNNLIHNPAALKAQFFRTRIYELSTAFRDQTRHIEQQTAELKSTQAQSATEPPEKETQQIKAEPLNLKGKIVNLLPGFIRKPLTNYKLRKQHIDSYVRGFYYFSDAWPLNFWNNFHPAKAKKELSEIKALGFNSIFVVIPWRGFQPDIEQLALDPDHLARAKRLIRIAKKLRLNVIPRLSYCHSICNKTSGGPFHRTEDILTDRAALDSWLFYLQEIHKELNDPAISFYFLSWEDFWHTFDGWTRKDEDNRLLMAKKAGYQNYIESHFSLEHYNSTQSANEFSYNSITSIPIPLKSSPRYLFYLKFLNHRIRQLFDEAENILGQGFLGMEVRADLDRYIQQDGTNGWFENDLYLDIKGPVLTYWAPFMGAENNGESLSCEESMKLLKSAISRFQHRRPVLNQFNFIDRTPEFVGKHAEINSADIAEFLQQSAKYLADHTLGTAFWAIRDYHQNMLYNANFSLALDGWTTPDTSSVAYRTQQNTPCVEVREGSKLNQSLIPWLRGMGWIHKAKKIRVAINLLKVTGNYSLKVSLKDCDEKIIDSSASKIHLSLDLTQSIKARDELLFSLEVIKGQFCIQRICLYGYEFDNDIIDVDGRPGKYFDPVKSFNISLYQQLENTYLVK